MEVGQLVQVKTSEWQKDYELVSETQVKFLILRDPTNGENSSILVIDDKPYSIYFAEGLEDLTINPIKQGNNLDELLKNTKEQYQSYYKQVYIKPYVGYRFLIPQMSGYKDKPYFNKGLYDNYKVLAVSKEKIIKEATVVKTNMMGEPIGKPEKVKFETKIDPTNKVLDKLGWEEKGWKFQGQLIQFLGGIANDSGIPVKDLDTLNWTTKFNSDNSGMPIPTVGLVANVIVSEFMSFEVTGKYVVVEVSDDQIKLQSVMDDKNLGSGLEKFLIASKKEEEWFIQSKNPHYKYVIKFGKFDNYQYVDKRPY